MSDLPQLPNSWAWQPMDAVCQKIQDGTHFSPKNQSTEGAYRYVTAKNVRPSGLDLSSVTYLDEPTHREIYARCDAREGDVLLVKDGVNTGDAAINTVMEEISLLSSVCMLRPDDSFLLAGFLRYYLLSPTGFASLTGQMSGTAIKRIILAKVRGTPVPVAPLTEQTRIVDAIEEQFTRLDSGVAALERVEANLKRYKASVLKAACEGKLTDTAKERQYFAKDKWKPIDVGIASMEQGWSPRCERVPADHSEWGVIKTTAVQAFQFNGEANKRLPDSLKPRPALELAKGDLLITRAGPRARAGVTCLVRETRTKLIVCDKVYRIRCQTDVVSPSYLELILNAPQITDALNAMKSGISDSGVNLTQKRFRDLLVPLPPISIQLDVEAEVYRQLSLLDDTQDLVGRAFQRCDRLRQSILKRAFEGKLVEQDSSDEPASVLLDRIRASRDGNDSNNSQNARPGRKRRKNSRKSA